jgi:nucleotide-binding universal stress UspA family protein
VPVTPGESEGKTIVVGVDGSDTARKAAEAAARLAVALGANLSVVTAYDDVKVEVVGVGSDEFRSSGHDRALATATTVAGALGDIAPTVEPMAREGQPADVLIEVATDLEASMIVVGNRRMQGIGRLLGSVANDVAHRAPCDVHIVKTT